MVGVHGARLDRRARRRAPLMMVDEAWLGMDDAPTRRLFQKKLLADDVEPRTVPLE